MSDLTDDELNIAATEHDRLSAINVHAYVDMTTLASADRLQRAACELQRRRGDDIQFRYDSLVDSLTGVTGKATVDEAMTYVSQLTADNSELHARLTLAESARRRLEAEHNRVQNDTTNKLIGVRRELSRVEAELRELKGKL